MRPSAPALRLVLILTALLGADAARGAPPHVVLIVVDDLGWMVLRCQGNDRLNTPRIDALARQGVRFTSAYASAPVCSPTRAEGADVLAGFAEAGFVPLPLGPDAAAFGLAPDADGILRLGPFLEGGDGGTDGYQIFRFQRVDRPASRS